MLLKNTRIKFNWNTLKLANKTLSNFMVGFIVTRIISISVNFSMQN